MKRRDVLRLAAAAPLAVAASSATQRKSYAMANRPNILFVHCHDLGTFLHCYGVETVRTPNLDAFARQGVRFANSFCSAPQCSPSRASIFTGRYPHNNGVMGLTHAHFAWDLHPGERHMAQILGDAGYAAEAVGIIHETRSGPKRCGYEKYTRHSRAAQTVTKAIERLEHFTREEDRPFFLSVGTIEPHRLRGSEDSDYMGFLAPEFEADSTNGVAVPGFLRDTPGTRAELAELQGAVHHVDTAFGRLMKAVDDLGLAENTLVVFTTDHGYAMPRAKCSLYDPGMAVALMMRLPSRPGWHGGAVYEEMIPNIDYLPTILDLLGIDIPENVQGKSFTPLLDGQPYTPNKVVFGEISHHDYYDPRRSIRTETHKLIVNFSSAPFFMDPSQSWRPRSDTIVPKSHALAYHEPMELYDLREDPWELKDLARDKAHAETRRALMRELYQHLVATEDPILDGAITPPLHRRSLALLEAAGA